MENPTVTEPGTPSPRRRSKPVQQNRSSFNTIKALQTIGGAALIVATLFTLWTPANLFTGQIFDSMLFAIQEAQQEEILASPTPFVTQDKIGIVAGHWKDKTNQGFVCSDGLTEEQLNLRIATLVMQILSNMGYRVDLLEEQDTRLTQYKGLLIISIHNDTCEYLGSESTGFKVAPAMANSYPEKTDQLATCLVDNYRNATGLRYQTNKITTDMSTYHNFIEVHSTTPVIIIETGYMNLDRQILTEKTDQIAQGIVDGILCYINGAPPEMEVTETP